MSGSTIVALLLAAVSTTLTNLAYLREHDAVSGGTSKTSPASTLSGGLPSIWCSGDRSRT
jgi:hypothetical protein